MKQLAHDLVTTAETGKVKNSVVRYFMQRGNFHEYFYASFCGFGHNELFRAERNTFAEWKAKIKDFLTLDFLFENYVASDAHLPQTLSTINVWKTHPNGGGLEAFDRLNNHILLRMEVDALLREKEIKPKTVRVKYLVKEYRGKRKYNETVIVRGDLPEREIFTRGLEKAFRYCGVRKKNNLKINSVRARPCHDALHYSNEFYKVYTCVCSYYGVEPVIGLLT